MSFFFSSAAAPTLQVELTNVDARKKRRVELAEGEVINPFIYAADETVQGSVQLTVPGSKGIEILGVKAELKGWIELHSERGNRHEFVNAVQDLASAGLVSGTRNFTFKFADIRKPFDTYYGVNVQCRYFVVVTVSRSGMSSNLIHNTELCIQTFPDPPRVVQPIKMEVGIEEFLHIEFEYDRDAFHLHDVVTGKVYFLLVRINIMHMDVSVLRRETTRTPSGVFTETDTLLKFEVMDGAPVAGEVIPIRLFLTSLDLTPTYEDVDGTYDVRYYLNLVLVDDEERRYFKQSEIRLFRSPVDRPVLLLTDGSDATSRGVGSGPARPTPAAATGGGGGSGGSGAGAPASLPPPPPPSSATPLFGTSASTASSAMKGTGSADDWL